MEQGEEGEISPIKGEIDSNFAGLETERKKKLRKQMIFWGAASAGVIILVTVIIVLILNKGGSGEKEDGKKEEEEEIIPNEVYGNITCVFDLQEGEAKILSENFNKDFALVIYVGEKRIKYNTTYNFNSLESKTVRYEIHTKEVSLKHMFSGVEYLKSAYFTSNNGIKVTSLESTFELCQNLETFSMEWDTSALKNLSKTFMACFNLQKVDFKSYNFENVEDMSSMFALSNLNNFTPKELNIKSVKTMNSMFYGCYSLTEVKFPEVETPNLKDMGEMFFGCNSLYSLDITKLDTSNVMYMNSLFAACV